jgi:hypothetical protein
MHWEVPLGKFSALAFGLFDDFGVCEELQGRGFVSEELFEVDLLLLLLSVAVPPTHLQIIIKIRH